MLQKLLSRKVHPYIVFANNTDVGKTILTAGLVKYYDPSFEKIYLKPVQTGYPEDSDVSFNNKSGSDGKQSLALGIYNYKKPVSPHLAIENSEQVSDDKVVQDCLQVLDLNIDTDKDTTIFVETAGGVLSPTLSGSLQADLYRKLNLPIVLIGDGRLGGIGSTLSALESLWLRGYDVAHVVLFQEPKYANDSFLQQELSKHQFKVEVTSLPLPPNKHSDKMKDESQLDQYFVNNSQTFKNITTKLKDFQQERVKTLDLMYADSKSKLWWPFTQHKLVETPNIIESAFGDNIRFLDSIKGTSNDKFDGCSSWWTQSLGHAYQPLALAAAYAAGKYGHVMYPENAHIPAYKLATQLLESVGTGWAEKVFYSDNGSTAVEVALKMALAYSTQVNKLEGPLKILGLEGGYHGDTIGAMDASNPNPYNAKVHWYEPKGYWLTPPSLLQKDGKWNVSFNGKTYQLFKGTTAPVDISTIFDLKSRQDDPIINVYTQYIDTELSKLKDANIAALILEPVVMGAGGMLLIDPIFQRLLVQKVRANFKVPVIIDEVFTGFYRLGKRTGCDLLDIKPDIAVYSKALTGGVVPLGVTMTSNKIYDLFQSDSKLDCLLHGHSYTAYPVGCQAALTALNEYQGMSLDKGPTVWDKTFLDQVSQLINVHGVYGLGQLLVIELKSLDVGYASNVAVPLVKKLSDQNVYLRPLGNTIYLLANLTATKDTLRELENTLISALRSASSK